MVKKQAVEIAAVTSGSIAEELGVEAGDKLLRINNQQLRDYIDYKFLVSDLYLELLIEKSNGEEWLLEIEKGYDEQLGIELPGIIYDGLNYCQNNCLFCFVDQSPPLLRETLTLKDDDYRFSFLEGSYITLSNLDQGELKRIKQLRLSPLYISVHTTNSKLRVKILGNKEAGDILSKLGDLAQAGIEFHTQIVLCPEINDGVELEKSIRDLVELGPALRSLAIVPVGLTKFRTNLYQLRSFTAAEAREIINQVSSWQQKLKEEIGKNFVYLADEFYLLAAESFPSLEEYNDFPQLENGIGLVKLFRQEFTELEAKLPSALDREREFTIVTGSLGAQALEPVVQRLEQVGNLNIELLVVTNWFFGQEVTVTGLLTAQDIISRLKEQAIKGEVLLPAVVLNEAGLFIDDLSLSDVKAEFPKLNFSVVENNIAALIDKLINN